MEYYGIHYDTVIKHHDIKGQKWGVRRYQNPDGTLTEAGRKRLNRMSPDSVRKEMQKAVNKARSEKYGFSNRWRRDKAFEDAPTSNTYAVTGQGRKYVNDYANNLGRKLTVAYLNDLGFDKKTSEYIDSIIKKSGAQVLD